MSVKSNWKYFISQVGAHANFQVLFVYVTGSSAKQEKFYLGFDMSEKDVPFGPETYKCH